MRFKKSIIMLVLAIAICVCNTTAFASSTNGNLIVSGKTDKKVNASTEYKWKEKNGKYYCYQGKKKLKNGVFTINNKKYYFDKNGVQRIGWRKIGNKCYFFNIKPAEKGYMIKGKTVDGVKLKKNGQATPKTTRAKLKLPMMLKVQKIADNILDWRLSKTKLLRKTFDFVNTHFQSSGSPNLGYSTENWDIDYANSMINRNGGNCFGHAAIFGYLANALGYSNVMVQNDTGHAWVQIGDLWYDPSFERWYHVDSFAVSRAKSGTGGRMNWAGQIVVSRNCDK